MPRFKILQNNSQTILRTIYVPQFLEFCETNKLLTIMEHNEVPY